jgi:hypothetical protein
MMMTMMTKVVVLCHLFIKEPNESFIIYTNYRCIFSN